jgi:hypothetical protein
MINKMTKSLSCNLCGEPIKYDDKHVSQRTGKKIPLDIETNEPHDCPVWRSNQQQQSRPVGHRTITVRSPLRAEIRVRVRSYLRAATQAACQER